ncbi:MAG: hypothetical protein RL609_625 [Bacteroidota bacterium]
MKKHIAIVVFCAIAGTSWSQGDPERKISVIGQSRGQFYGDHLVNPVADSVTAPKMNSGNVLADLGLKIQVNKTMEVLGMVRIRNDYGGFWGSGVSFDVRQLTVRGLIGHAVRYSLGDINYKMTPFTLWNNDQEWSATAPQIFADQMNVLKYDHFYNNDHSWRQQGVSADGAFVFSKGIQELKWGVFSSRVRTTDFGSVPDRIFSGVSIDAKVKADLGISYHYANLWDIEGTANTTTSFRNPVHTLGGYWNKKWGAIGQVVQVEMGMSKRMVNNDVNYLHKQGNFIHGTYQLNWPESRWTWQMTWNRVEAEFRSPGAQTRRLNPNASLSAFQRTGNDQSLRTVNLLDLMRESNLYNLQLQTELGAYLPYYDNITPYGVATPNRQGFEVKVGGKDKSQTLSWFASHGQYQETRGEGTVEPRKFVRTKLGMDGVVAKWGAQSLNLQAELRRDLTDRQLESPIPSTHLQTDCVVLGVDFAFNAKWHALLGTQYLRYNGNEMVSVVNYNGEITNFNEQKWNGKEWMNAVGMKYVFSEKSFLTIQNNTWNGVVDNTNMPNYRWKQWMILYQMNF